MDPLPQTVLLDHSAKVLSDAEYLARCDARQTFKDWIAVTFSGLGITSILIFEYVAVATVLTAMLFAGGVSGFGNALIVVVLTIGYHVIVEVDGAEDLKAVMRKMVKLAIPLIAIALSSLIAFQFFQAWLDFIGSTGADGGYREGGGVPEDSSVDVGLAVAEAMGALFAPIPALLILFACFFLLIVSLHTVHLLIGVIDRRLEAIGAAQNRHPVVRAYRELIEEKGRQAHLIANQIRIKRAELPSNLRRAFANDAYKRLTRTLNEMRWQIEMLPPGAEKLELFTVGRPRAQAIPGDIKDLEIGRRRIAEIRDAVRPAAIKMALDAEYATEPDHSF